MPLIGTTTATSSGAVVVFSTGESGFRARTIALNNLGPGAVFIDIHSTAASSTGYTVADGAAVTLTGLGGVVSFSVVASTAAGVPEVSYLASR